MEKPPENTGTIARSAGVVSVAVMCSRVLGLVREQVFAMLFGAGMAYDSFVVAFRIPNLLRDLFGEGALSAAFVAVFTDYDTNRSKEETWRLANNVLCAIAIILSILVLAGMLWARKVVLLLAPDFAHVSGKIALTSLLTTIMFPFLLFISLAAVVMGILNAKGRFFVPSMASSFFNLGSIVGGVLLALVMPRFGQPAIVGMAVGTLIGGILQLSCQFPVLFKTGFAFKPVLQLKDPGLRRIFTLMIPAIIGLSATQLNIFINTYFASSCAQGSVSWLNYAFRLVQFPIGVFGVALSIATLPVFSRYAAKKDVESMRRTFSSSMVMGFCLTIPASVGLVMLANPIIRVIFEHGAFGVIDTGRTAEALSFYAIGLFAYAAVKIIVPVFYALNDTRYPVIASFLAVVTNICIILLFIGQLQHKAIALSTSCSMIGSFLLLSAVLYRKLGGYPLSYIGTGFMKVLASSCIMALYLWSLARIIPPTDKLVFQILSLLASIASSGLLYAGCLHILRLEEFRLVAGKILQRLRQRPTDSGL